MDSPLLVGEGGAEGLAANQIPLQMMFYSCENQ